MNSKDGGFLFFLLNLLQAALILSGRAKGLWKPPRLTSGKIQTSKSKHSDSLIWWGFNNIEIRLHLFYTIVVLNLHTSWCCLQTIIIFKSKFRMMRFRKKSVAFQNRSGENSSWPVTVKFGRSWSKLWTNSATLLRFLLKFKI